MKMSYHHLLKHVLFILNKTGVLKYDGNQNVLFTIDFQISQKSQFHVPEKTESRICLGRHEGE